MGLTQDPFLETADVDVSNNAWPRKMTTSRLELFKQDRSRTPDLMKDFNTPLKGAEKDGKDAKEPAKDPAKDKAAAETGTR